MTDWLVFALGLALGSFVNVCIWRLPRQESPSSPKRSYCPACRHDLAWYDNLPVASFLLLRGRCRHCLAAISLRYPAVELLAAGLCLGLWRRWEPDAVWWLLASAAALALVAVAFIDWETFLIPDVLSLGLLGLGLLCAPLNPYFAGGLIGRWLSGLTGAAAGFFMCWATAALGERIFKKESMGGGDVKLLAAVGAWTGALGAFDCLVIASFFGSIYGVSLMLRGKLGRADPIPFGPFLSAAAIFNLFYLLPFGFPFLID